MIKKELVSFIGKEIVLPRSLPAMVDGRDSVVDNFMESSCKLVIFYDSVGCSSCRVSQLYKWDEVIAHSIAMRDKLHTIFIFAPKQSSLNELRISLRANSQNYPMFIDTDGEFLKLNPSIPADSRFHTFLLDRENKVVMVGDPSNNERLWELYKEQIRTLTQN